MPIAQRSISGMLPSMTRACYRMAQVQDLSKVYTTRKGSFLAAENISLDIPAGKMTALLGPSGSGRVPPGLMRCREATVMHDAAPQLL